MKIAFILSTCENSGPFIVARDIINNIIDEVEVDIFYLKESAVKLDFKATCFKIELFNKTDFSSYDIVHSHGFLADGYSYINRKSIKKRITTLHQKIKPQYSLNYNRFIGVFMELIWFRLIKDSDCIVTLSKEMCLYYQQLLKQSEIEYIYNGMSPVKYPLAASQELEQIKVLKEKYTVLGVSAGLVYRKGFDQLIKALALDTEKRFALILIGDGNEKVNLVRLSRQLGVDDRCLFLGYKNNAIGYFDYFDLYIMCSRAEGFALCVIEAASQKIPVVSSNLPVFEEVFERDEIVMYELENIRSLIEAINTAFLNKEELSRKIYSKYKNFYTAGIMAKRYMKLYHDLITP